MVAPSLDLKQDFFSLFNLPVRFQIDNAVLEQRYRELQAQVHPDKAAHLPEAEQRKAMQMATLVNEAYQTLRDPLKRGRYLLTLRGVDTQEESNTAMPVDFLMQQMEWREALEEAKAAKDAAALDDMEQRLRESVNGLHRDLAHHLDGEYDPAASSGIVRKLKFLEKFAEEISAAYDDIDS